MTMPNNKESNDKSAERQTAKIAAIKEIIKGKYLKQEGWEPNYILTNKDEKISRVNLIGIVVTIPDNSNSIFIDDGTDKIEIRNFDQDKSIFSDITIGDIVMIIGRPKEFNNELYINGEIVKKIKNKGWLEFRKKEIILKNIIKPDIKTNIPIEGDLEQEEKKSEETKVMDKIEEILLKIKGTDEGSGCDVQSLAKDNPEVEKIIEQLLLKGEIFEITPGKVKILE